MGWKKVFLILMTISLVVYSPALFNGFVWDDEEQIVNNPFVKDWRYLPSLFSGSTFGGGGSALPIGGYYKPLMSVWYLINHSLFGEWAGGFHLSQALLHGVNGGLLYLMLVKLLERLGDKRLQKDRYRQRWMALWISLIWVVHPGNVESVAYAASAQEGLFLFFSLLSFLVILYRERLRLETVNAYMISAGLILLGLLSKETAILMPLIILFFLYLTEKDRRQLGYYLLLLLPVGGIYGLLRFGMAEVGIDRNPIIPIAQASFIERMLTVPEALYQHFRVMFVPIYLYIGHHQVVREFGLKTMAQILFIVGFFGGAWWKVWKERSSLGGFFLVWLVLGLGLVSNVYPLDMTFAERWVYFPLIGLLGLVLVGGRNLILRREVGYGLMVLVLGLSLRSMVRVMDWHDGLRLYSKDSGYAQNAFDLENNLGVELYRVGRREEAKVHFEKSIELQPHWWTAHNNLGAYYDGAGEASVAAKLYQEAIDNGNYFLAYENLAKVYYREGDPRLEEVLRQGLGYLPNNQTLQVVAVEAYQDGLITDELFK
jgi:protein O-mannosyl-transferase